MGNHAMEEQGELMSERPIMNQIMLDCVKAGANLFRNNTAQGWAGHATTRKSHGEVVTSIRNAYPLRAGLCVGSSDLIGWSCVTITPDMIGKTVAIFTAIEVKENTNPTKEQLQFIQVVKDAGGIAGIAHNSKEAMDLIIG
jgi:hypothetical protein